MNCKKHIKLHGRDEAVERAKHKDTEPYNKIETTVIIDDNTVTTLEPEYSVEFSNISLPQQHTESNQSINGAVGGSEDGVQSMDTSGCMFSTPNTGQGSLQMVGYESSVETVNIPLNTSILQHALREEEKDDSDLFHQGVQVGIHSTNINLLETRY